MFTLTPMELFILELSKKKLAKQMVSSGGPEYEGVHSHFTRINKKYKNALSMDRNKVISYIPEFTRLNNLCSIVEVGLLIDILTFKTDKEICKKRNMTVYYRRKAIKELVDKFSVLHKKHIIYSFILYRYGKEI